MIVRYRPANIRMINRRDRFLDDHPNGVTMNERGITR